MRQRGFTLLEMLVTATVLLILASAVIPMAKNGIRRQRELELRRDLREMRMAIDDFKAKVEQQKIKPTSLEANGYPETLEQLVEGVQMKDKATGKIRFLRRIPVDPFTGKAEWGMRAVGDDPTSSSWGGSNVYDVYSLAPGTGSNGAPYRDW
jgi:general secretion pathway protein G